MLNFDDDIAECYETVAKMKDTHSRVERLSLGDSPEMKRMLRGYTSHSDRRLSSEQINNACSRFVDPRECETLLAEKRVSAKKQIVRKMSDRVKRLATEKNLDKRTIDGLKSTTEDLSKKNRKIVSELTRVMKENRLLKKRLRKFGDTSTMSRSKSVTGFSTQIKGIGEDGAIPGEEEAEDEAEQVDSFIALSGFERKFAIKYFKSAEIGFITRIFKNADEVETKGKTIKKFMSLLKKWRKKLAKKKLKEEMKLSKKKVREGQVKEMWSPGRYRRSQSMFHKRSRPASANSGSVAYRITNEVAKEQQGLLPGLEKRFNNSRTLNRQLSFKSKKKVGYGGGGNGTSALKKQLSFKSKNKVNQMSLL